MFTIPPAGSSVNKRSADSFELVFMEMEKLFPCAKFAAHSPQVSQPINAVSVLIGKDMCVILSLSSGETGCPASAGISL